MTPRDDSDANSNRWSDLDRPPLNAVALRRALVRNGGHEGLWCDVDVVQRTGSTNSDLVAYATEGTAEEGRFSSLRSRTPGAGVWTDSGRHLPARASSSPSC